jgi:glycolate oxidase subunit GlcD
MARKIEDQLIQELRSIVGKEGIVSERDELLVYECDGLMQHKHPPRAVVFPSSTKETAEVIRALVRAGVPFAPRGAGTGLSGGALAHNQAVIIEMARMRRLLKLDPQNRFAVVETGMINAHLSREAVKYGLHYVPDPSSQTTCTIGGNIAENAGGIHCLKYGMTVDHVIGLRAVLSTGEIVELGGIGAEGSLYDLLGLFIGSEGTFGIATEATLRLTPLPTGVRTMLADFTDVNNASRTVSAIIAAGLIPAALEMMDGPTIRALEASVYAAGLPTDTEAALLIELDGLEAGLEREAQQAEAICRKYGARNVQRAANEYERKRLWAARKSSFGAMGRISPDLMIQDAVIPRSKLPEVLAETYRIASKYSLIVTNVFHAGDGNLHPVLCFDSRYSDQIKRVKEAGRELMETCVRAGGSITGEHGVGLDKSEYLPLIFSDDDMEAMLRIRAAFDPTNLCNPGKIFPTSRSCGEPRPVRWKEEIVDQDVSSRVFIPKIDTVNETASAKDTSKPTPTASIYNRLSKLISADKIIDRGIEDSLIVNPDSIEEACEILQLAEKENWTIVPAGSQTWINAGNQLSNIDLIISTSKLSNIIEHVPADLITIVQPGITLKTLNTELNRAGQWIPLDPPDDGRATMGGIVATNIPGAQSFGYGSARNYLIGMRVALADGRVIKMGGRVVKNVAGYDLGKLFCGSYGTLGLIVELNFKLRPLPFQQSTVLIRGNNINNLISFAHTILASKLLPVATELISPAMAIQLSLSEGNKYPVLIIRFAGVEEVVSYQINQIEKLLREQTSDLDLQYISDDQTIWESLASVPVKNGEYLSWRASTYPTEVTSLIKELVNTNDSASTLWHAGIGTGLIRVIERNSNAVGTVSKLQTLRKLANSLKGRLVIENGSKEIKEAIDSWGIDRTLLPLIERIKRQLDPKNRFSPGRMGNYSKED